MAKTRDLRDRLEAAGCQVINQTFLDGSTECTIRYSYVSVTAPTMEQAVARFVEQLLKFVPVVK